MFAGLLRSGPLPIVHEPDPAAKARKKPSKASPNRAGSGNLIVDWLHQRGLPVTRENYIRAMDPQLNSDESLGIELEMQLPEELRKLG